MTVTVTGNVKDVTGIADNNSWSFATILRFDEDGDIVTARPQVVRPVAGILSVELVPGHVAVTYGKTAWQCTVLDEDMTLKELIEAGVAYPPDTAQDLLNAAMAAALPPIAAAELDEQVPTRVTTELQARQFTQEDDGEGGWYIAANGVPLGDSRPAPATTVSAVVGWDAGTKKATGGIVPLERFDPDSNGFNAAMTAAIAEINTNGGDVHLESGKTYYWPEDLTFTDQDIRIDFNGARVLRAADGDTDITLYIMFSLSAPQDVVALTSGQEFTPDWPNTLAVNSEVTRIELADTSGWSAGDYAVIVSDDAIPGANPAREQLEGERFRVAAVAGNYLYAARELRAELSTNVRIARMTNKDCVLSNPWFEDEGGSPVARRREALHIRNPVRPQFRNVHMEHLLGTGLNVVSGIGGVFKNGDVNNLRTDTGRNAYGYGARLDSCCDFRFTGFDGDFVRHIMTTGAGVSTLTTPDSPDLWKHGSNFGHIFSNCTAGEVGNAAYDLHEEAADCLLDGINVSRNHREVDGQVCAFQLRGRRNAIRNSSVTGIGGVRAYGYDGGGDFRIENFTHTLIPGVAESYSLNFENDSMSTRGKLSISNYELIADDLEVVPFQLSNASVRADRIKVRANYKPGVGGRALFVLDDSDLRIQDLFLDITHNGEVFFFLLNDSDSTVRVDRIWLNSNGTGWRPAWFNNQNGRVTIGEINTDGLPYSTLFNGIGSGSTWSIGDIVVDGVSLQRGVNFLTDANVGATAYRHGIQVLNVPLGQNRTVTEGTLNLRVGWTVRYVRTAAATGAYWYIGTELLLPGMWCDRTWTGTAWITTGRGALSATPAYTASNVTTDRSFDANSAPLEETNDVLGTLIADLKSKGVIAP